MRWAAARNFAASVLVMYRWMLGGWEQYLVFGIAGCRTATSLSDSAPWQTAATLSEDARALLHEQGLLPACSSSSETASDRTCGEHGGAVPCRLEQGGVCDP